MSAPNVALGTEQSEQTDLGSRIMRARDLATLEVESPEPLWEGFLCPGSVHLLSSVAGLGKTTLLLALLSSAAENKPFVGRPFPKPLRSLYVDLETPLALRKEKMLNIGHGRVPEGVAFIDQIALPTEEEALRRVVVEHEFDVVVVDTIGDAFLTENEDDNAEATRQLHVLRGLARGTGCCVVRVAHHGKDPARGVYSARGASARPAHADVVINVDGDDDELLIKVAKNKWVQEKASLRLIKAGNDSFAPGDPVPDRYSTAYAEAVAIVEEVAPSSEVSAGDLKKLVMSRGVTDSTARKAIETARNRGLIKRVRHGVYVRAADPVRVTPATGDRERTPDNDGAAA